jgi:predicted deacylase
MKPFRIGSIFLACLGAASLTAWAASPTDEAFRIGGLSVPPGEAVSGYLEVPKKADGGTVIPVTILHGAHPGPVLACVAGVHGYEYPPILALYNLKDRVDPKTLRGTLILVHIANVPTFAGRAIYYTPGDHKNLNRLFPGDANGSISQRIAFVINEEVISRADALLDMHGGDGNEALMPYTYWMVGADEALNEKSKALALAFGLRHIIIDNTRGQVLAESKYLGNTALLRGKPAITTETGALGSVAPEYVRMAENGVVQVMRQLGMVEGPVKPAQDPVWIDRYEVLNSASTGLFTPLVRMGEAVVAGQKLGFVTDYLGRPAEDVRAPFEGIILYILGTPPTSTGEPLAEVGHLKK